MTFTQSERTEDDHRHQLIDVKNNDTKPATATCWRALTCAGDRILRPSKRKHAVLRRAENGPFCVKLLSENRQLI